MEVTILGSGTSQGVPMIGCRCEVCRSEDWHDKRLRSSIMVESEGVRLVIDTGPDFRCQMLRQGVDRLDGVLYTHEHKDHTGGMDDLRAFNYWQNGAVDVYCTERVSEVLHKDFDYAFATTRYPGVPEIEVHIIDRDPFFVKGLEIIPLQLTHMRLPILGFRINQLCYITDCNYISQSEIEKIKGCKVFIINALRRESHLSHFNLSEALQVIERVDPEHAYLTHCSHQLGLYKDLQRELPENVELAYDQLKIIC